MLLVISNANGKTAKEISERTGIELSYVWLILRLLFDWGILRLEDGRYYIDEDARALCGLVIKDMLRDIESWDFFALNWGVYSKFIKLSLQREF